MEEWEKERKKEIVLRSTQSSKKQKEKTYTSKVTLFLERCHDSAVTIKFSFLMGIERNTQKEKG